MNRKIIIILLNIYTLKTIADCGITKSSSILDLVKKNHPNITLNMAKIKAIEKYVDVAKKRPNPELEAQSTVGDSSEGNIYKTSIGLLHTVELGGKRDARINVAKKSYETSVAFSQYENEEIIIETVLDLHRLRQIHELIPLYHESLEAFNKILNKIKNRKSLSPEQQVEAETLELAINDYKLKLAQLESDKNNLNKHLSFFMGKDCIISKKSLPQNVNLSESFNSSTRIKNYSKLNTAIKNLELAKSYLDLEKSNSYPNLKIGPIFEYEKMNLNKVNTAAIALTIDLPLFNINGAGRAKASAELIAANLNLRNVEQESHLDIDTWIVKYNQYRKSLLSIADKARLEKKHTKIEALFQRGVISTSLVIESHRQLIEFFKTRFEFENGATQALWNIYKLSGQIDVRKH